MKLKRLYILLIVSAFLTLPKSCDLSPYIYSDVKVDEFFRTPGQFASLIASAYAPLGGEHGFISREGFWSLQELTADGVVVPVRGTHWYDAGVPMAMQLHTWTETTRDVNNGWGFAFHGIGQTNDVLSRIVAIMGDDREQWNDVVVAGFAETKVLRAWYHMLAMDLYGNIAISDGEREIRQYQRREVFEWIEQQILDNIDYLDRNVRYGAVTRSVAHMILAKLYLNAEIYTAERPGMPGEARWECAIYHLDAIIYGGFGYILNDNYFTAFSANNTGNREIIFPIVFCAVRADGNMFHLMTLHYAHEHAIPFTTRPWNGHSALPSFFNSFEEHDRRRAQWFVGPILNRDGSQVYYQHAVFGPAPVPAIIVPEVTTLQDPTEANSFQGARFVKFEIEPGIGYHANSDFPIYRFADVLLMKAEALMRLNGGVATQEAVDLVNQIRRRAGVSEYTVATLTLDELLAERGRELAWEGHRRTDLIRFGQFHTGMWEFMPGPRSINRTVFPIPRWVMDANPGVYTQNDWQ